VRRRLIALVNGRDVAERFGKRHDNALRDIDALTNTSPDLGKCGWFRETVSGAMPENG
jgi:phage regulator Rha-like protein